MKAFSPLSNVWNIIEKYAFWDWKEHTDTYLQNFQLEKVLLQDGKHDAYS